MTPLAAKVLKELTLPQKQRTLVDHGNVLSRFDDVHYFEVTAVFDLMKQLAKPIFISIEKDDRLAFLPATRTWIEYQRADYQRTGFLLERLQPDLAIVYCVECKGNSFLSSHVMRLPLAGHNLVGQGIIRTSRNISRDACTNTVAPALYAWLAMINTPRVIGRRTHEFGDGIKRRVARSKGTVGKFPLRAWTEIVLEVTPPMTPEGEHATGLTGLRALHFCREHLRVRLGSLERVREHWRGEGALGIKQSRYKLVPPRQHERRPHA